MKEYKEFHLYCGSGGAAIGFKNAVVEYKGMVGRFRCLGGVDSDPEACADFEMLTGVPATKLDLFTRADYIAFHGKEPPENWREATAEDVRAAAGYEIPDVVFQSPPCKGLSALLPSEKAASEKYQALNRLVVRGMKLTLEAFADDLPAVIMLENVPRITSRGKQLLRQIKSLLKSVGYLIHPIKDQDGYHDCGEIGGLGQHRKRYLLIARHPEKMTALIYQPIKRRVKTIGEILGALPIPDDPSAGPMHRLQRLKWLTWVRLALIPPGGDWRDLEKIAPEHYRLEYVPRGAGSYGVQNWDKPGATVIGSAYIKGSNPVTVADPRLGHVPREGVYRVQKWNEPSTTVTGTARTSKSNGAAWVADPRLPQRDSRHPAIYQVVRWEAPGPCVTGTRFGSGAPAIADPRMELNKNAHHALCQVNKWEEPANTVTGATRPTGGAISVADPRMGCRPRGNTKGPLGVQAWEDTASTVFGSMDVHSGPAAVADHRIPKDNDRPDPPPVIIALDGTWHRPLTTLELAALQGFPVTLLDGKPLALAGKSDARWRERIGNAVPPPAARAIAEEILTSFLVSEKDGWALGHTALWVTEDKPTKQHEIISQD